MKQITKIFALATVLISFSVAAFAQATATATATIVTPIAISRVTHMNFGNVVAGAGTVVLLPAGTRSATGGVTFIPASAGTITAATYTVTGLANATYSITLPGLITVVNGATTMDVDTWTSNYSPGNIGTIDGTVLSVGATLHVNAGQTPGVYTSANFTVTVNYN